jgi:hypothetical protein
MNTITTYYGPHTNDTSGTYYMPYGTWSGLQNGWRFCAYCKELFWGAAMANTACPTRWETVIGKPIKPLPHVLVNDESLSQATSYALQFE